MKSFAEKPAGPVIGIWFVPLFFYLTEALEGKAHSIRSGNVCLTAFPALTGLGVVGMLVLSAGLEAPRMWGFYDTFIHPSDRFLPENETKNS